MHQSCDALTFEAGNFLVYKLVLSQRLVNRRLHALTEIIIRKRKQGILTDGLLPEKLQRAMQEGSALTRIQPEPGFLQRTNLEPVQRKSAKGTGSLILE